jgi:hypothetical protein
MKLAFLYGLYGQFLGLLPHLRSRFIVTFRNLIGAKSLYPTEREHDYPQGTTSLLKHIEDEMKQNGTWGNYDWDTILEKQRKSKEIAQIISDVVPFPDCSPLNTHVKNLRSRGWSKVDEKALTLDQVSSIHDYLIGKPVYPSHAAHWSSRAPSNREDVKKNGSLYGSYDISTILQTPGLAKLIADHQVLMTISDYFGCVPTISSINLFWSFHQHHKKPGLTQQFHRDVDDYRSSNFFCLVTDTSDDDGAYLHIEKTHSYEAISEIFDSSLNQTLDPNINPTDRDLRPEDFFRLPYSYPHGHGYDLLYEHFFSRHVKCFSGGAGMTMLTDGHGLHKGTSPAVSGGDRLLFWSTYTLTNDAIKSAATNHYPLLQLKLSPWKRIPYSAVSAEFGDDEVTRYVMRNIVRF